MVIGNTFEHLDSIILAYLRYSLLIFIADIHCLAELIMNLSTDKRM